MIHLLLVALGGAIGAGARHIVNLSAMRAFGLGFPVGTLFVNVVGSFAMGLAAGYFAFRGEGGMALRLFLMTGILGGFTTFSAFSLETVLLFERGQVGLAALYVVGSVAGSVAGLVAGLALMRGMQ
jgi:CrcB protein